MRLYPNEDGTLMVGLRKDGVSYTRSVKRLIAQLFVEPPKELESDTPLLLDGNDSNCAASNIVWRPRWFVWKYSQNFKHRADAVSFPVKDQRGVEYETVLSAAKVNGMLCVDIRRSLITKEQVYPSWLIFELV
jgi:hypothetical protein